MTTKFSGDYAAFFTPSSPFAAKITEAIYRGATVVKTGDQGSLEINDAESLTVSEAVAMADAGVEIEGFELIIELTPAKYASNVPVGIPNRVSVAEDGTETALKWNEWKKGGNTHNSFGGKHYVMTNANISPAYLKASEFAVLHGLSGYKLLTLAEYNAKLPVSDAP
jgi:hypothetical protein